MTRRIKIIGIVVLLLGLTIFGVIKLYKWNYYREYNEIINSLSKLPNVKVLNASGNPDISLEEISIRLSIAGKGEIVLDGLSKDSYNYPKSVPIGEIGGFTFTTYSCDDLFSFRTYIDFGDSSIFGKLLGIKLNKPEDVINNYDNILSLIDTLPKFPNAFHFYVGQDSSDVFVFIKKENTLHIDSLLHYASNSKNQKELMNYFSQSAYDSEYERKLLKSFHWRHRECIDKY